MEAETPLQLNQTPGLHMLLVQWQLLEYWLHMEAERAAQLTGPPITQVFEAADQWQEDEYCMHMPLLL